jgi:5-(carboxyamino)imidazole ribonucleotide synthase
MGIQGVSEARRVGILGSGQLSQMLVQSSAKAGVELHVYASSATDSAAQESDARVTVGALSDSGGLSQFLSQVSVCGFESELIDCKQLRAAAAGLPIRFVPQLDVMERLSEKVEQKRILRNLGIPTAPFVEGPISEAGLDFWFEDLKKRFGNSFVVKWSKHGYDGRGVLLVTDDSSLKTARLSCKMALARGISLYAEAKVPFVRELAMIGCHSTSGDFATYPLVISEQEHGVCRRVRGPATSLGVNARFETLATQYASSLAKSLPFHGAFGLELFETPEGDLWVNEIAPRVHNSGHFSQDASQTSQFENHLRALTGQILGETRCTPFFAMLNLLGPQGVQGKIRGALPTPSSEINLHWYNKAEVFPGRKLGHLGAVAENLQQLTARISLMESYERIWTEHLSHHVSERISS